MTRTRGLPGHPSSCIQISDFVLIVLAGVIVLLVAANVARQRIARRDEDLSAADAAQRRARVRALRTRRDESSSDR